MTQEEELSFETDPFEVKVQLTSMLSGGLIIDVANADEAKMAEEAGAVAVMAVDAVQSSTEDLPTHQSIAATETIQEIQAAVSIPVMARCRIGHIAEAQILEAFFLDFVEESPALPVADSEYYLDKHLFQVPFLCGCSDFRTAYQRVSEGAAMLRTSGGVTSSEMSSTVREIKAIMQEIRRISGLTTAELIQESHKIGAPLDLLQLTAEVGHFPVPLFAAGGIRTAADAAFMRQLGADGVMVGREVFQHPDGKERLLSLVAAVNHYDDPEQLAKISLGLAEMIEEIPAGPLSKEEILALRGW